MQERQLLSRVEKVTMKLEQRLSLKRAPLLRGGPFLFGALLVVGLLMGPLTLVLGKDVWSIAARPAMADSLKTGARYHAETPTPIVPSGGTHDEEIQGGHGEDEGTGHAEGNAPNSRPADTHGHSDDMSDMTDGHSDEMDDHEGTVDDHGAEADNHGDGAVDKHGLGESEGHSDSHSAKYEVPSDFTRGVVLGGFAGINGVVIVMAAILKKRMPKKSRPKLPGVATEQTGDGIQ